jgi:hypothetical protein
MNEQRKFYCYSIQLKNFLKLQGINYECRGRHSKSGNLYWVFPNSPALDEALLCWNKYKLTFWKEKRANGNDQTTN